MKSLVQENSVEWAFVGKHWLLESCAQIKMPKAVIDSSFRGHENFSWSGHAF